MGDLLAPKTKAILKSLLVRPRKGLATASPKKTLDKETIGILDSLARRPSKDRPARGQSTITPKTQRQLDRLKNVHNNKVSKQKQTSLSKETLLELNILDAQIKPKDNVKKDTATLNNKTIRALATLTPTDPIVSGTSDAIKQGIVKEIIQGVSYDHIQKKMTEHSLKWSMFLEGTSMPKPLGASLCLYSVDTLKDIINNDDENIMVKCLLNNLLQAAFEEPDARKVATVVAKLPIGDMSVKVYIHKTLKFSNFFKLFECFKKHLPFLSDEQKNYLIRTVNDNGDPWPNIQYFMNLTDDISEHLKMFRELRLSTDQMDVIAENRFQTVTDFERDTMKYWLQDSFGAKLTQFEDQWTTMSAAEQQQRTQQAVATGWATAGSAIAAGFAAGSAITGGIVGLAVLAGVQLLNFRNGQAIGIDEYMRQKMICEYLYRSAQERGLLYHNNDYKKIERYMLKRHVHVLKKNMLRAKQHAEETERWWQTAIRTPLTVEEGVAAVSMIQDGGAQAGFFEWVGGGVGAGVDSILGLVGIGGSSSAPETMAELNHIRDTVEKLNQILVPLEKELEQFERFAEENLFFCKFFKAQMDCINIFHKGFFSDLDLSVSEAEDTLEKLQSYKKLLTHLFELSKLRLKLSKVRETIHYKHQNEIIKKINKIAEKLGVAPVQVRPPSGGPSGSSNSVSSSDEDPLDAVSSAQIHQEGFTMGQIRTAAKSSHNASGSGGLNVPDVRKVLKANNLRDTGNSKTCRARLKKFLNSL